MKKVILPFLLLLSACNNFEKSSQLGAQEILGTEVETCATLKDPIPSLQPFPSYCKKSNIAYMQKPIPGVDIKEQSLDLYYSKDAVEPRPLLLLVHGGGWITGAKDAGREINIATHLAAAGYVVASIGYQLTRENAPSYPTNIQQCIEAALYLKHRSQDLNIDPSKISIWGGSAGGHLALMTALANKLTKFNPSEENLHFTAIIDFYGITNLLTRVKTAKDGTPSQTLLDAESPAYLSRSRVEAPELWAEASPVTYVTQDIPRVMLVHSDNDTTVDRNQSAELYRKIQSENPNLLSQSSFDGRKNVLIDPQSNQVQHLHIRLKSAGHSFTLDRTSSGKIESLSDGTSLREQFIRFLNDAQSGT